MDQSDAAVEEAVPAVLLLKDEDEGNFVDGVVLKHVFIPFLDDLLRLVDAHDFQSVVEVRDGDLLDLKHIVAVEDGLEVLGRQELRLELIQTVVVWVLLVELLSLDRLQHLQDRLLWVSWLLIQNVRHQLLDEFE